MFKVLKGTIANSLKLNDILLSWTFGRAIYNETVSVSEAINSPAQSQQLKFSLLSSRKWFRCSYHNLISTFEHEFR